MGRLALGLILLAIGLGWLLQSLEVIDIPWDTLLPASLIAVGAVVVVGSRTGRHSGLIALGIVLTLVTALTAAVDVPLIGGAGQRVVSPQSVAELESRYDMAVGQLVIDLTDLEVTAANSFDLAARVGMGELVVEIPDGVDVFAHARAGLGDVQILGEQASGFAPEETAELAELAGPGRGTIRLELSVGLGSVKVND